MSIVARNIINHDTFASFSDSQKWETYLAIYNENQTLVKHYETLYESSNNDFILAKIKDLNTENMSLKDKINNLELIVFKQTHEINELKPENKALKTEINELKIENRELRTDINEMKSRELYKKYLVAIQDINHLDQLENVVPILKKVRRERMQECHYIYDDDTPTDMNNRRTILLDKLQNMPVDVQNIFNNRYPTLLRDIMQYIAPNPVIVNKQDEKEINYFWTI